MRYCFSYGPWLHGRACPRRESPVGVDKLDKRSSLKSLSFFACPFQMEWTSVDKHFPKIETPAISSLNALSKLQLDKLDKPPSSSFGSTTSARKIHGAVGLSVSFVIRMRTDLSPLATVTPRPIEVCNLSEMR